ncbi:hypothetical protein [Paenibacillus pedocola]|uniref:hypothetical protein n=1 Tax=Paenibacillus pedocola TaxID=3242193 RepID=UPI002877A427|nr:hypothetical protein [Paenibacillus typhae]
MLKRNNPIRKYHGFNGLDATKKGAAPKVASSLISVTEPDRGGADLSLNAGITAIELTSLKVYVFVLTPFHSDEQKTYEIIREVCVSASLRC